MMLYVLLIINDVKFVSYKFFLRSIEKNIDDLDILVNKEPPARRHAVSTIIFPCRLCSPEKTLIILLDIQFSLWILSSPIV